MNHHERELVLRHRENHHGCGQGGVRLARERRIQLRIHSGKVFRLNETFHNRYVGPVEQLLRTDRL